MTIEPSQPRKRSEMGIEITENGKAMTSKIKRLIPVVIAAGFILVGGIFYSMFITEQIREESSSHLLEIYNQANNSFSLLVERNWKLLKNWASYTDKAPTAEQEETIKKFITEEQVNWGFTEFYFIDEEGNYITLDGKKDKIQNVAGVFEPDENYENRMFMAVMDGGDKQVIFSAPTISGTYMGFPYSGACISYDNDDVEKLINISAFYGSAESYVIYPDGDVMFSTSGADTDNIYDKLREGGVGGLNAAHLRQSSDRGHRELNVLR